MDRRAELTAALLIVDEKLRKLRAERARIESEWGMLAMQHEDIKHELIRMDESEER